MQPIILAKSDIEGVLQVNGTKLSVVLYEAFEGTLEDIILDNTRCVLQ